MNPELLRLYLVLGSAHCLLPPEEVLEQAIAGGITLFQYREKGSGSLAPDETLALGKRLLAICRSNGVPFIVNDDLDLMLALDADGLHIGQEDGSIEAYRLRIGSKILGVSAHDLDEARVAIAKGADYLGVGPMFPTSTKPDVRTCRGPAVISSLRENGMTCPIVGIGGITAGRAALVRSAGADGVAVISAITQAVSPREAAQRLKQEVVFT